MDFPNYQSKASMNNEPLNQWTMKSKALASNETMNNEYYMTTPLLNVSIDEVDRIAHYLITKLNNPVALKWYYYAAWRLPESVLICHLEYALERGRNPAALFTTLVKKELST